MLVLVVVFLLVGLFSIRYFRRHMPNTVGLRSKKYKESRLLTIYIVGYSIFLIVLLVINILELHNCRQSNPQSFLEIFITVLNLVRLSQFIFFFVIVFKN
jgi:heme/copper-type cytochrome/quinol oxidase subunit 2